MFSKPIAIAASVASAQAALMSVSSTANDAGAATHFSDAVGCGLCLSLTTSTWISGGTTSTYAEEAAAATVAIATATLTGDACCASATGKETAVGAAAAAATYCGGAFPSAGDSVNTKVTYTANDYFQATIAQCPHNTANCTAAGLKKDGTTAITFTDQRYLNLDDLGSYVTLKMLVVATASLGTAPSLKQRKGDVCTWVVAAKCDAPVLTVPSTTGTMTASPSQEFDIQVTEWTGEFVDAAGDSTWLATNQSGLTSKKWYPPLATNLSAIITDLLATAVTATTPNNMYGDVLFKSPDKDGTTYISVPGNTLLDWITNVKAVYTSYDAEVVKYNAEAATWKTYAEYTAPAPGLFDWLFGAAEDPDKPTTVSSPLQPTQPVAVPDTIGQLAVSVTTTVNPALYTGKLGYGYPSAYMITPIASKSVKPFGTRAGGGIYSAASVAAATTDNAYSMRMTTNKDSSTTTGYKATCDYSYLMITGWLVQAPGTALTIELKVTAEAFASTLEESIPTRPGAVTAPVAAPAGAAQLAASAVAAALTALYLF